MARPRLIYFDLRSRGEPIRLAFEELGEAYDEDVVTFERWRDMKETTPFAAVPLLEDGELKIPQALAIYQHIARTRDLYGADEKERSACDVAVTAFDQAIALVWEQFWRADCAATLDTFASGTLETQLTRIERWFLRDGAEPRFWAGPRLSFADIFAFRFLDEIDALFPQALRRHRALLDFHRRFLARPRIAAYVHSGRRPRALGVAADGLKLDPRPLAPA
jgi:glutathione S-transferase